MKLKIRIIIETDSVAEEHELQRFVARRRMVLKCEDKNHGIYSVYGFYKDKLLKGLKEDGFKVDDQTEEKMNDGRKIENPSGGGATGR